MLTIYRFNDILYVFEKKSNGKRVIFTLKSLQPFQCTILKFTYVMIYK